MTATRKPELPQVRYGNAWYRLNGEKVEVLAQRGWTRYWRRIKDSANGEVSAYVRKQLSPN